MARVHFDPSSPVQRISGTYCGVLYRYYSNGLNTAFALPHPSPEQIRRDPAARAAAIVADCVSDIQRTMDITEATKRYSAIRQRVIKLYAKACDLYPNTTDGNRQLQQAMLDAYHHSRRVLPSRKVSTGQLALTY